MANVWIFSADEGTATLRGHLREAGFDTFGVYLKEIANGDVDLRAAYQEAPPDVLLVEVAPPTAAGWRLAEVLRTADAFADCAILWLTSDPERLAGAVHTAERDEVVLRSDDVETIVHAVQAITADADDDDADADDDDAADAGGTEDQVA
jgi:DNA-binding NarL/FixJ family response regulator